MKRLILFDTVTTGHHINYAEFIIRYLEDKNTVQWKFITDASAPHLSRLLSRFPHSVIDWGSHGQYPCIKKIRFLRGISKVVQIRDCIDYAAASQANIIHFLSIDHLEIPLYLALLTRRRILQSISCKVVCTVHKEATVRPRLRRRIARRVLRYMSAKGWIETMFVHVSESATDISAEGAEICQIPYPVDNDIMRSASLFSRKELCDRLGLPFTNKPTCLLFGSIRPVKGVTYLLQALKHIEIPCSILIVGKPSPSLGIDLVEWARTCQSEKVELQVVTEYVPDEDIPLYYALADLILMPYTHDSPGAGGPLLLASAAGKPVVASDVGELGRKVRSYNLGILCQPESVPALAGSLNKALSQLKTIKTTVLEGAERCAIEHSWYKMAKQVYQKYENITTSQRWQFP